MQPIGAPCNPVAKEPGMTFPLPAAMTTDSGQPRRLGVELEFAGLDLETISTQVTSLYGGRIVRDSRFSHRITDTRWGTFTAEIDTALLKDGSYLQLLERLGFNVHEPLHRDRVDDLLARLAGTVVPHEIVTPPIPFVDIHELEALRAALQTGEALGTRASLFYAFGLHLNPEAASLRTEHLVAILRAFLLLYDWLQVRGEINWARRISPYINEFPHAYRRLLLDPGYEPDQERLIADYLTHNPTRNRALDMLPLFCFLAGDQAVRDVPDADLVSPRPAFHYRLPNCRVDEADWTLASEWSGWVSVEWLAERPALMRHMVTAYLKRRPPSLSRVDQEWALETEAWLRE